MAGYEKFQPHIQSASIASRTAGPGGAVAAVAADVMEGLSRTVGALADRAAQADGAQRGAADGMDPEFRPTGDLTIRGMAYDQAALRSHAVMLDGQIREDLAALYETTKHDPAAFDAGAKQIYQDRISNLPAQIQPDLAAGFERQTFSYTREIARTHEATVLAEDKAALQATLAARTADFGRMAYQLGLDPDADARLSAEGEDILGTLLQYGPKEAFSYGGKNFAADGTRAGLLAPDAIGAEMIALNDEAAVNRIKGAFDRTKGLAGQQKFLKSFQEDWAAGDGVAKSMSLPASEKLQNWMDAKIRDGLAEQRAIATAIRSEVTDIRGGLRDYRSGVNNGVMPSAGVVNSFMARAIATGDAGIIGEVRSFANLVDLGSAAARASPVELQQEISRQRAAANKGGVDSPDAAAKIELMENTLSGMNEALRKDPLTWAQRAGVVDVQPLVIMADPSTGQMQVDPAALQARRAPAQRVAAQYGVPFMPFTDEETAYAKVIEDQGGDNMLRLTGTIFSAFGSDARTALAQLSDKAPALAHLGGLMANGADAGVLHAATAGFKMLAEAKGVSDGIPKGISRDPAAVASATVISRRVAGAFENLPELRAQVDRTAEAIYVGRRGLNSSWDPQAYARAYQEAAGATFTNGQAYGGISSGLLVPGWLKSDAIDDVIDGLTLEDYRVNENWQPPVDAEGKPLSLATLRQAVPVSLGPGLYELRLPSDGGATLQTRTPEGEAVPYVLDLNNLRGRKSAEWKDYTR